MGRTAKQKYAHVPAVVVGVQVLETRLDVALAQGLGPDQRAAADGVRRLLRMAEDAAYGISPPTNAFGRWWRGTLVESAFQNLHAARAQMVDVYADEEIAAEIPAALARSQQALHAGDPRRLMSEALTRMALGQQRAFLRRAIEDSYDAMDSQHERLRNFRNIILMAALCIVVLVGATILIVAPTPPTSPGLPASGEGTDDQRAELPDRERRHVQPRQRHRRGGAARAAWRRTCSRGLDPEPARHLDAVRRAGGTRSAEGPPRGVHRDRRPRRPPGQLRPWAVGSRLAAADPRLRPGPRLRPAGLHLHARPQGADSSRRPAGEGPDGRTEPDERLPTDDPAAGARPGTRATGSPRYGSPGAPPMEEIDLRTDLEVQPAPPDVDDVVQDDGSRPMPNVPVGDHR